MQPATNMMQPATNMMQPATKISIYVPRVPDTTTPEFVGEFMHRSGYGQVSRVDILPLSGCVGRAEMFIHFTTWYDTREARLLQTYLSSDQGTPYKVFPYAPESTTYWLLNRARSPMTNTERRLEDRINALEEMIEMQASHFEKELDRRDQIMEQVLARIMLIDEPADYAPGEGTNAERERLLEQDPLYDIPDTEAELPLAPNELENRKKYECSVDDKNVTKRKKGKKGKNMCSTDFGKC